MTTRTKIIFVVIIGLAAACIAAILTTESLNVYTLPTRGGVTVDITVAVAPPLQTWAEQAAQEFSNNQITVKITSLKGTAATNRLSASQGDNLPDAWIAEATFVREMADAIPYTTESESVAKTGLVWVIMGGQIDFTTNPDWATIRQVSKDNVQFRIALPSPGNTVEGIASYASLAAAISQQTTLPDGSVINAEFRKWLNDILLAVPDKQASPLNQLKLQPPKVDIGLILESDIPQLNGRAFTTQIPPYNVEFNFPYFLRERSTAPDALERRQVAEQFRDFLLTQAQQEKLQTYGLRVASATIEGQLVQIDGNIARQIHSQN